MLRLLGLLFAISCSTGAQKAGGEQSYLYDVDQEYGTEALAELAPQVVETKRRDPPKGKLDELFGKGQPRLKRIGIVVFESMIQPTRGGLAEENLVYLSESGKQVLTENFLRIWEQSFPLMAPRLTFVSSTKVKRSKALREYGMPVEDHIKAARSSLAPDDIFYLEKGRLTPTVTILNPRGMRDLSFVMVPAAELMGGPKFSEQNKHFLNDVMKELKLDAALVIMSEVSWTASHFNKRTGEYVKEEALIQIKGSILVSLSSYRERLKNLGVKNDFPAVTVSYRAYEAKVTFPVKLTVPKEEEGFDTIQRELLSPATKAYKDLAQMTLGQMARDLQSTF